MFAAFAKMGVFAFGVALQERRDCVKVWFFGDRNKIVGQFRTIHVYNDWNFSAVL
jgi:hypothetical protein